MNKLFGLLFGILFCTQINAQTRGVGISVNLLSDYNWSKPLGDFQHPGLLPAVNLFSRTPISIGLQYENRTGRFISPTFGLYFIHRNLVYSEWYTTLVRFSHQTIEAPILLTMRKEIGSVESFFRFGSGLSYILTDTENMSTGLRVNDVLVYQFSVVNPKKLNIFLSIGFGIDADIGKAGRLEMGIYYNYHLKERSSYRVFNSGFDFSTSLFRSNYAKVGFTFFPAIFSRHI